MIKILQKHSLLISALIAMFVVGILAYNNLIPREIKNIPHYDSILHFCMFGFLGLVAHYSFKRKRVPVFGRNVPLGPTLILVYAFLDETFQVFSKNRTFDLMDLFWGILGILTFITLAGLIRHRRSFHIPFISQEFLHFTLKQLRSVLFAGSFLFLLFISTHIPLGPFYRYDMLFIAAVLIQIILIAFKLETVDEAKTIFLFHIIGLCLELYKTHPAIGSWSYPEPGFLKIAGVPLYSGFMYAAVGSYIAHAWKVFKIKVTDYPPYKLTILLCFFIYLNFFTNHYIFDFRIFLFAAVFAVFYKTNVYYTPRAKEYRMPLIASFILIGFFVWVAENIATFYGAWKYPGQIHAWEIVSLQKITSWFLLVIICFIIVAYLKYFKATYKSEA